MFASRRACCRIWRCGDDSAYRQVVFTGDSELASLLSELVRHLEWDVEEDLSRLVAWRRWLPTGLSTALRRCRAWRRAMPATDWVRIVAEYLTEEQRAFITAGELEALAVDNETLRDDVARLEARINQLTAV